MNKILKLFIAIFVSVSLFGCSMMTANPSSVVEEKIIEFKKKGSNAITEDFSAEVDKELEKQFYEKVMDFDYEIVDEKIEKDEATVTVKIKTYAFGEAFADAFADMFSMAFEGAGDQEITQFMYETFNGVEKERV